MDLPQVQSQVKRCNRTQNGPLYPSLPVSRNRSSFPRWIDNLILVQGGSVVGLLLKGLYTEGSRFAFHPTGSWWLLTGEGFCKKKFIGRCWDCQEVTFCLFHVLQFWGWCWMQMCGTVAQCAACGQDGAVWWSVGSPLLNLQTSPFVFL